jgi:predicted dehydrogenase
MTSSVLGKKGSNRSTSLIQLVTLAPGHFHAALVQKEMLPGIDPHVVVYGPSGEDLDAHLERISRFNSRSERPTAWQLDVRAGDDWLERFRAERPGNVAVIAGRNRSKIDLILEAVSLGYCVLADKPWIVVAEDFPKLERVFAEADRRGVFAWDIMTERFEATTCVQRELMNDPEVFGELITGSAGEPALEFESVHYLSKQVAGVPLRRPAWWFDPEIAGDALADVGTHLADLAIWLAFPKEAIDYKHDIEFVSADRWSTPVDRDSFSEITGLAGFPPELSHLIDGDHLAYHGNGTLLYRLASRFVRLTALWGVRANGPEGDTHLAIARGSRATIKVQHDAAIGPGPQVFVIPVNTADNPVLISAVERHRPAINLGDRIHVPVAACERSGHESHFASVVREFIKYFNDRSLIPSWERPNLLAKYHVTTARWSKGWSQKQ